jgi:hypothetical protein
MKPKSRTLARGVPLRKDAAKEKADSATKEKADGAKRAEEKAPKAK